MSINLQAWLAIGAGMRAHMLDPENANNLDEPLEVKLAAIHPALRVVEPREVPYWEDLQEGYERRNKFTQQSNSSRTSLQGDVVKELVKTQTNVNHKLALTQAQNMNYVAHELESLKLEREKDKLETRQLRDELERVKYEREAERIQQVPGAGVMQISGADQSYTQTIEHEHSNREPAYEVFRTIDTFEHTLRRYYIQPHYAEYGGRVNDYQPAILHFLDPDISPIRELMVADTTLSIVFHCLIEGVERRFTFNQFPHSNKTLVDHIHTIYAEGGSDTYKKLRTNIYGVSVNVVTPYSGGASPLSTNSIVVAPWFETTNYHKRYDNSCFYACIRHIWKAMGIKPLFHRYEAMREALTGSLDDQEMPMKLLAKAESIFGVKFIVLGSQRPDIHFRRPDRKFKTYEEMCGSYLIEYDTLYFEGTERVLSETSDSLLTFTRKSGAPLTVNVDGITYSLICLANNHYSAITRIYRPRVCIKCGSRQHTEDDLHRDTIRLECLEEVRALLTPEAFQAAQPEMKHIVFDFETVVWDAVLYPYAVAWKIDGKTYCEIGRHCLDAFMDFLRKIKSVKMLIGYNSSRFDNFFVVKDLLYHGVELSSKNCTIHNNQILRIATRDLRMWDICQFTKCSLRDACEAFGLPQGKLEFDHTQAQDLFNRHGWKFVEQLGVDKIRKYNMRDVDVTEQLFHTVRMALTRVCDIDPTTCMTLSQLAFRQMNTFNHEHEIHLKKLPTTIKIINGDPISIDTILDSIPAGRVQMFCAPKKYDGDHVQVDANGLYQFICLNYKMPTGDARFFLTGFVAAAHKGNLYLAECQVDQSSLPIKLVGVKQEGERIDWCRDQASAWLWGEEIDELERLGCSVHIGAAFVWSMQVEPFKVMEVYAEIRAAEKAAGRGGGVVDLMAKLLSNAITGKCYQRNREDEWAVVSTLKASEKFKAEHKNVIFDITDVAGKFFMRGDRTHPKEQISKPRHIGARIYAMARLYMFQHIHNLKSIAYMDTDGFIMDKWEYIEHPELHDDVALGKFKVEAEGDVLYLLSLKNYALCHHGTGRVTCPLRVHTSKAEYNECAKTRRHDKFRLKGYHDGDKWCAADGETGLFINERMFKAMVRGPVYTTTERIRKQFVRVEGGQYRLSTLTSRCEERLIV